MVEHVERDAGLNGHDAFRITDAVFSTLAQRLSFEEAHDAGIREALTDGEWADVTARLPDSFAPLLPLTHHRPRSHRGQVL